MALIDWNENGKSPHILRRYAGFGVPYYTIPSNNRELRRAHCLLVRESYYTIPSNNRELRHYACIFTVRFYYTIPSNNRELRRSDLCIIGSFDYTIPSNNRELRQILLNFKTHIIIPYQVITGNYDVKTVTNPTELIIPYQVITGNYDPSLY